MTAAKDLSVYELYRCSSLPSDCLTLLYQAPWSSTCWFRHKIAKALSQKHLQRDSRNTLMIASCSECTRPTVRIMTLNRLSPAPPSFLLREGSLTGRHIRSSHLLACLERWTRIAFKLTKLPGRAGSGSPCLHWSNWSRFIWRFGRRSCLRRPL